MTSADPWRRTPIPRRSVRIPVRRTGESQRSPAPPAATPEHPLLSPAPPILPEAAITHPSPPPPSPDDWKERYLRLQADVANTKQRTQKRYAAEAAQQMQAVLRDLLPVIDNLQAALDHAGEANPQHLRQGVELTLRAFLSTLSQYGVTAIEAQGKPFDPRQHEALGQITVPEMTPGHVARVLQNGYMIHDRLLRPAKVLVAA